MVDLAWAHPWRELRTRVDLIVQWVELPHDVLGLTDGVRKIWLAKDLTQVERRCTLAHELIHIDRGDQGCQPPAIERLVEHNAAMWLLPNIRPVADALCFNGIDRAAAADVLWVDEMTLTARLDPDLMHPAEKAYLSQRLSDLQMGI